MLNVNDEIQIPLREFTFSYSRSPGPGGQNVNKVNTQVTLKWPVCSTPSLPEGVRARFLEKYRKRISQTGDLVVTSHRFRDQGRNVADSLSKLREMILSVATPPRKRKVTRPSRAAKERRLEAKRQAGDRKKNRRPPRLDD